MLPFAFQFTGVDLGQVGMLLIQNFLQTVVDDFFLDTIYNKQLLAKRRIFLSGIAVFMYPAQQAMICFINLLMRLNHLPNVHRAKRPFPFHPKD